MTRQELDLAVDWAAAEGWNPGLSDAECFYRTDPGGFFIGLLDGTPIGSISAVAYGDSYGFLGFYIVRPEHRGRGFGIQLWHAAMERLKGRNIGLDGVVAQQDNYKKSGFRLASRNIRYQWMVVRQAAAGSGAIPLSKVAWDDILAYDLQLFGVERESFLECWITRPETTALGVLDGPNLAGYGVLRKCRNGFKVGPLFADTPPLADLLLQELTADLEPGSTVFLDVPEVNAQAVSLADAYGMTRVFETARMYTGEEPDIPLDRWFGVTSFELG
ncbi:MAG: GNAT family N-acetyltransferase [Desulfomonile tiedjei]|nr:GNAT family N-acetyltransferase [Desulfomonile tiedjei]